MTSSQSQHVPSHRQSLPQAQAGLTPSSFAAQLPQGQYHLAPNQVGYTHAQPAYPSSETAAMVRPTGVLPQGTVAGSSAGVPQNPDCVTLAMQLQKMDAAIHLDASKLAQLQFAGSAHQQQPPIV